MYDWPAASELEFLVDCQLTAVGVSSWPVDLYLSRRAFDVVITLEAMVAIVRPDGVTVRHGHLPDIGVELIGLIGTHARSVERRTSRVLCIGLDDSILVLDASSDSGECFRIVAPGKEIVT